MKKILFALLILIGFNGFSQLQLKNEPSKEVKYEKGKFFIGGEQIPSYEMKKIFAANLHSLHMYKAAKSKETWGGFLLGVGSTMTVVDLAIGLFSDAKYPTALTYAGLGAVAVSIPILAGRKAKMEDAVKSYNESLKNTGSLDFDLNALANQNGIGIQIKFKTNVMAAPINDIFAPFLLLSLNLYQIDKL